MEKDLEARTKRFALSVIRFSSSLPRTREGDVLARQLLRSATSIGANYRRQIVESRGRILLTRSEQSRKKLPKRNIR